MHSVRTKWSALIGGAKIRTALVLSVLAPLFWSTPVTADQSAKGASASTGQAPEAAIVGSSRCPKQSDIWDEIVRLIPADHLGVFSTPGSVRIEDWGDRYRIRIRTKERSGEKTYVDPARDCERRARFAAVFTVLTLMPPELFSPNQENRPDTPSTERKVSPKAPGKAALEPSASDRAQTQREARRTHELTRPQTEPDRSFTRIELGALINYWPPILEAPAHTAYGAELRASFGTWSIVPVISISAAPRQVLEIQEFSIAVTRFGASLGGRFRSRASGVALDLGLGVAARLERLEGMNLLINRTSLHARAGLRADAVASYILGSVEPFVGIMLLAFPAPTDLAVVPRGVLGNTSYLEFGSVLGAKVSL